MTRPRGEPTTYRARGGHATDWANPTRYHIQVRSTVSAIKYMNSVIDVIDISFVQLAYYDTDKFDRIKSFGGFYTSILKLLYRNLTSSFMIKLIMFAINVGWWNQFLFKDCPDKRIMFL